MDARTESRRSRSARARPTGAVAVAAAIVTVLCLDLVVLVERNTDRRAAAEVLASSVTAPPRTVTVAAGGGTLDVHRPAGAGPHPVLLYVHGGGWTSGDRAEIPDQLGVLDLVQRGWAVVSVGYRAAGAGSGITALDQADDVAAALEWIATEGSRAGLGDHVVGMGHSAGAHLVALVAATLPAPVRPDELVLVSGVYDFADDVVGNPILAPAAGAARGCPPGPCASRVALEPGTFADDGDPPTTIVHGEVDRIVPVLTARRYGRALELAGVPVDLRVVPGGQHLDRLLGEEVRAALARLQVGSADR